MSYNLGHPDNTKANQLAQCQRLAALWVNKLTRGKIIMEKVEQCINEYSEENQEIIRHWLNYYSGQNRTNKPKQSYRENLRWANR